MTISNAVEKVLFVLIIITPSPGAVFSAGQPDDCVVDRLGVTSLCHSRYCTLAVCNVVYF